MEEKEKRIEEETDSMLAATEEHRKYPEQKKVSVTGIKQAAMPASGAYCPKCGKLITHLVVVSTGIYVQRFYMHPGYGISYEDSDFSGDGKIQDYNCPRCNQTLFKSEADAAGFFGLKE